MVSKKDLLLNRKRNLKLVDTDKYRPKINCLEIDVNNTFKHELGKFIMLFLTRKGIDADYASTMFSYKLAIQAIKDLDGIIGIYTTGLKKLKTWEYPCSVSEARMRDGSRRDQHILDTGQRIEVVSSCDKSTVPYDDKTIIVMFNGKGN